MNAPISRSAAALLAVGAVTVLLLGAFTRVDPVGAPPALSAVIPAESAIESAGRPEWPADLSPGLADIIKLAQGHVDESVILAFIRNSSQTYSPAAEEILYLSDLGLSQAVIAALFSPQPPVQPALADAGPAPVALARPPPPSAPPAGQNTNADSFYNALAPYGAWTQVPDYGPCWQPTAETLNPDWRPYVDQGQWLYTDNGWYWQSDYSWGRIVFHYGRWLKHSRLGWVWVPGNVWGPAWVSWRIALSYSGWAPLPPGVGLAAAGLTFHRHLVAADYDFGLPPAWFVFVSEGNLLGPNLPGDVVPAGQAGPIYSRSVAVNNYSIVNNKVVSRGPGRSALAAAGTGPPQSWMDKIPARKIGPAAGAQLPPESDPLRPGAADREAAVGALPRLGPDLPVAAPPQPRTGRPLRWADKHAAHSNFAGVARGEPLFNHDLSRHDQNVGLLPQTPPPDPARLMAASVPNGSKSGK